MQAEHAFIKALVERYRDRVKHWEIWNEPNIDGFWRPHSDPAAYARLLRETTQTIRKADPAATIIGGAIAGTDVEFVEAVLRTGAAEDCTKFSFHPYGSVPETRIPRMQQLQALLKQYHPTAALWQGECGFPSSGDTAHRRMESP